MIKIVVGDCRDALRAMPERSVHACITSPPYYGLRNYQIEPSIWGDGWRGVLGMEPTWRMYVEHVVEVFREVRRVLRDDGVLWLNLGDSYATGAGLVGEHPGGGAQGSAWSGRPAAGATSKAGHRGVRLGAAGKHEYAGIGPMTQPNRMPQPGLKPKDLMMIPARVAIALVDDGWWLRNDIIWAKPAPMPESVTDRCTKSHEHVFLLAKSERYFFDAEAIAEPVATDPKENYPARAEVTGRGGDGSAAQARGDDRSTSGGFPPKKRSGNKQRRPASERGVSVDTNGKTAGAVAGSVPWEGTTRNKRDVWQVGTAAFGGEFCRACRTYFEGDALAALRVEKVVDEGGHERRRRWCSCGEHDKWLSHFACVDDETEALTPRGWRRHDALRDGDRIAGYDLATGLLTWQRASIYRYKFAGDLVAIEKRDTSQWLTPNHRCLVRTQDGRKTTVVLAADLKSYFQVLTNAPLRVRESKGVGPDLAALLGWYVTEGEVKRGRAIRIHQSLSANPDNVDAIRHLLIRLEADFSENVRKRTWRGRPSVEVVFNVRGAVAEALNDLSPQKTLNPRWLSWPINDLRALMEAMIRGDGHTRADGRCCLIQKSKDFIDIAQAIGLRFGWRGCVSRRSQGDYVVYFTEGGWLTLRGTNGKRATMKAEWYEGDIWCPSVPSTFWLARRAGKAFITGNTFPADLVEPMIKAGCPEGGTVLDPFAGAGTTGLAADRLGRDAVLLELNPEYSEMIRQRIAGDGGMFAAVSITSAPSNEDEKNIAEAAE